MDLVYPLTCKTYGRNNTGLTSGILRSMCGTKYAMKQLNSETNVYTICSPVLVTGTTGLRLRPDFECILNLRVTTHLFQCFWLVGIDVKKN
jgi:hypothetical protein